MTDTDILVIGGGVNGCGIARDAAGRGLSVTLCEMGDLAGATSSASTKLFHGGLRYLEFFEFGLVRKALVERGTLLEAMPHIAWPMRFVLPYDPEARFEGDTPTSKLLSRAMPWMKGRRPDWLIRTGLFLYDRMGGRGHFPGTKTIRLADDPAGASLKPRFEKAFEYSDAWVEDSRLVALNARDAAQRGADVRTRCKVFSAERREGRWHVETTDGPVRARALVNAAGPWVEEVLTGTLRRNTEAGVRLVRGSHVVTRKLFDHGKCYFFQGRDGRIIFAIPYEYDFTLIGTTDAEHDDLHAKPEATEEEVDYLLAFASEYFADPVTREDVVHTYSGVRPLYDDGAKSATAATRDYVLLMDEGGGAPLLSVFGGKITTYRTLAQSATDQVAGALGNDSPAWTEGAPLPGGDFPVGGHLKLIADLKAAHPFLSDRWAHRLVRAYGTEAAELLEGGEAALGRRFGADLTECEIDWLRTREFARTAEDVLWRRSKLGLHMTEGERAEVGAFMGEAREAAE
ncbi:homodimeric glycerol 3-phosphate dehydrogenase (quinone) [Hasllibacter halocynthiae]|uniref:Glycerol-3-phosphate dehydrogenase n=1 Tax=Hasllibacter halocynthiae TaxID=595589 RepID=A0A2T0X3Z3_9RHOB|nr:glycerol-3-phosphate dehydrogenase [Hasllibacter halocynthiae]PRY93584.1 homodimeric glycerol 3-phosphate dehydrogenase (quinone) [Hasllibacter halocynthiae]